MEVGCRDPDDAGNSVCDFGNVVAAAALSAIDVPGFLDADSKDTNGLTFGAGAAGLGLLTIAVVGTLSLDGLLVNLDSLAAAFSRLRLSSICKLRGFEEGRTVGFLTCCVGSLPSRDRLTPAANTVGCPFAPGPAGTSIGFVGPFFFLNVACFALSRILRAAVFEAVVDFLLILARTLLHFTFSSCSSSTVSRQVPSYVLSVDAIGAHRWHIPQGLL